MNKRFAISGFTAVLAIAVAAGSVLAPSIAATPGETVKMRQETMKQLGGHMKAIKTFLETGEGSAADVAKRATEIGDIAGKIPSLFPEGTGMDKVKDPESGAKPEIWLEWEKFTAAAKGLGERSSALNTAASGGNNQLIAAAFEEMGKNGCGSCHKPYRVKLEKK
ncbi:MAG: cytochrome c [Alphaproteobacteria bacterium]|nr:cytochrome c [Alphaproteobacteria bacterium]